MLKHDAGWDGPSLAARMSAALVNDDIPEKMRGIINAAENGTLSQAKVLRRATHQPWKTSWVHESSL